MRKKNERKRESKHLIKQYSEACLVLIETGAQIMLHLSAEVVG